MIIDHRYEVLESLGSGAWSNVYKVMDKRTGKILALKLFQYISSHDLYAKFSAEEMHHITKIEHPNLAHVLDFGHVGDHIYSICEYYDGSSLKNFRFRRSQLESLYDIIIQISYALEALHNQDMLHKDLKPENVLYRIDGNKVDVKVIDYGFSKIDPNSDQQNVTGSLPYLAPEVYLSKQASPASDYYSLGVLLYKITTGNFPFSIEQINTLITGSQHYFIPKFPSEVNDEIPKELEKCILRLLEKNPENRFKSAEEIINYINRIQSKQYPFSIEWSLVNKLKFNSYISRESYCHQILDYIESIEHRNGKIVSLIGGDGLGKDSILSLFRFHLLTGKYFLFDYTCSRQDHEPFFALIKEFVQSLTKEEVIKYDKLVNISEKFKLYLFQSTKDAKKVSQNQEELRADFDSVKKLLLSLSDQKPIIFIIRNAQFITKYTIEFLNYISPFITKHKILIVLSFNEYNKVNQITHTVMIQLPPLTYTETTGYIKKLLSNQASEPFLQKIWDYSSGNPYFVREMLVDLVQKKTIVINKELNYNYDFAGYSLPVRLIHSIYLRLSHINEINYQYLQSLSIVELPLKRDLIMHILEIKDKELYDFINDVIYNEVLVKVKQSYLFSYREAKGKLFSETDDKKHKSVSKAVISFYKKHDVIDVETCRGIINNAIIAEDFTAQREYTLKLIGLYEEIYNQDLAYGAILDVLMLDFNPKIKLSLENLILDLMIFQEKVELTGYCYRAEEVIPQIALLPELFEKYYILGTIYFILENIEEAEKQFIKASELTITGKQQINIWLYLCQVYSRIDLDKMKVYLDKLSKEKLPLDLSIAYNDRLAVYYRQKGELLVAIKIAEDFLSDLPSEQDPKIMIRLGSLHNNLGVFYSIQKNIEEADEHLNTALSIWKRFNIKRYLGLICTNLADLYLKQGITLLADSFSQRGYELANEQGLKVIMALALLNMGEARIKMGEFQKAEDYLYQSKDIILSINSTKFLDSIQMNLALVKSKIKNFGYYYSFIKENEPKLLEGVIKDVNPLVKTYFYYLFELGSIKKITKLIRKNAQINYHDIHEDEFYYNTLSLISLLNNDYNLALEHLKNATKYAGEVKNHYAITVFYLSEIECYIGLQDYKRANEILVKAVELADKYKYKYWSLKLKYFKGVLDLSDTTRPLRLVLRDLLDIYAEVDEAEYYLLKAKVILTIIRVFVAVSAESEAEKWFEDYKKYLLEITADIEEEDKQTFLKQNHYYVNAPKNITVIDIPSRYQNTKSNWNELQYSLLNVQNTDRIKFFIEKGLIEIIAPWKYQLMIYSEKLNSYSLYISSSQNTGYIITPEIFQFIDRAFRTDNIVNEEFDNVHNLIVPLQIKYHKIGFLIVSDRNELSFTKMEISLLKSIKPHITTLIMRIQDYTEINLRMTMMNRLMSITHALLRVIDIKSLEHEIVNSCIDFTGSSRGFLIKKDSDGNYLYQVAMDVKKTPLSNISIISKTALSECQISKSPIYTYNAQEDNRFKNSISVQDYKLHSIFCAPLIVNDEIYGFIYLDNFLDNTKSMYLNPEIITLLLDQIGIALINALQYESIINKSQELQSLEALKDEFMAIVSHELNTPLTSLQGYISRLKRSQFSDEEEKQDIIGKIETNVKKLILTTNDIMTMNTYNLKNQLPKVNIQIEEILNMILHEIEIVSRNRKMFIKTEISKDLPDIEANWEAVHLMIYNIVLNAIRFTNDFGTIIIGARLSAFQQEKLNEKEALVIYIQDNGIGIPDHQIKNVFRKFYELNEIYAHKSGTIEYRSSGLGLGLATSRRIAELHNGNIWLKSKENEGTTVFISLPIKTN